MTNCLCLACQGSGEVTGKADGKADVSLDSTLNASDLSLDVITEPSNDCSDWIASGQNIDETGQHIIYYLDSVQ